MDGGSSFSGYEGEVLSLSLFVSLDVAPDSYTAILDNPVVMLNDAYRVMMDYVDFDLTVKAGLLGDVNMDGQVTVADVTVMVSKLLGGYNGTFIKPLGDLNYDGLITVTDVTSLVNIILGIYKTEM